MQGLLATQPLIIHVPRQEAWLCAQAALALFSCGHGHLSPLPAVGRVLGDSPRSGFLWNFSAGIAFLDLSSLSPVWLSLLALWLLPYHPVV